MNITTVGELLHWSYANLAMAHAAVTEKAEKPARACRIPRESPAGSVTPTRR